MTKIVTPPLLFLWALANALLLLFATCLAAIVVACLLMGAWRMSFGFLGWLLFAGVAYRQSETFRTWSKN